MVRIYRVPLADNRRSATSATTSPILRTAPWFFENIHPSQTLAGGPHDGVRKFCWSNREPDRPHRAKEARFRSVGLNLAVLGAAPAVRALARAGALWQGSARLWGPFRPIP